MVRSGGRDALDATASNDEVISLLRDILGVLRRLEAGSGRRSEELLSDQDRRVLQRVLPLVTRPAAGVGYFATADALAALRALGPSQWSEILMALDASDGKTAAKRLGHVLKRGCGHAIGGVVLQRDGKRQGATIWRVVTLVDPP